ncbi:hypothetical protein GCM10010129_43520 [Streptomyces fumigatiscleroticus]|nr:hypothetical protein GCM10010129_43520 [Streptomyces fumigatiscleroticus]
MAACRAPAHIAAGAQAFVLGLVVQALFVPATFPPQRQVELLDDCLAALVRTNVSGGGGSRTPIDRRPLWP